MSIITIATDFGRVDGYTGAIKGVIKGIAPESETIDITDELPTIPKTALVLYRYYSSFPQGTVHLVVVDPTVGSDRRALAGGDGQYAFVGPDNGIFSRIVAARPECKWFEIDVSKLPAREISSTFHGRDIFAPAAALLSVGRSPAQIGRPVDQVTLIDLPAPVARQGRIYGQIIDVDRFGNLISNIEGAHLSGQPTVHLEGSKLIPFAKAFSHVPPGSPLAYVGSLGYLEVAVNCGRADRALEAGVGSKIEVVL